jgi:hypothetical protein
MVDEKEEDNLMNFRIGPASIGPLILLILFLACCVLPYVIGWFKFN